MMLSTQKCVNNALDVLDVLKMSLDHPTLAGAKHGFDVCLKRGIYRAIATGANEGSVTLTVKFEIAKSVDRETGEAYKVPFMKFKAQYSVPQKEGCDGEMPADCRIIEGPGNEYLLVNNQVSMEEILDSQEDN